MRRASLRRYLAARLANGDIGDAANVDKRDVGEAALTGRALEVDGLGFGGQHRAVLLDLEVHIVAGVGNDVTLGVADAHEEDSQENGNGESYANLKTLEGEHTTCHSFLDPTGL